MTLREAWRENIGIRVGNLFVRGIIIDFEQGSYGFGFDTSNLERSREKGTGSRRKAQKLGFVLSGIGVMLAVGWGLGRG